MQSNDVTCCQVVTATDNVSSDSVHSAEKLRLLMARSWTTVEDNERGGELFTAVSKQSFYFDLNGASRFLDQQFRCFRIVLETICP